MPARSTWKGFLKLSLVSVPVKAYTAKSSSAGEIRLNQLHADCHSRIQYKKTCPIHGEVSNDAIVSGYEYAKGQYVVIDTDELDKLRSEDDKAIKIDKFISPESLDPVYQTDKSYYLVPDGPVGDRPFALIRQGMEQENRQAIAQVVLHGREQVVLLRPMGRLLLMTVLDHDNEIVKPAAFEEEAPAEAEGAPEEMKLVKTLIEASTPKKFDFSQYKDVYMERLTQLIEAKVAGKEIVAAPAHEERHVINLMEALRQSIAQTQGGTGEKTEEVVAKPPRKMAASKRKEPGERKRKTS
jgi:DNA end-binding protein Ku